MQINLSLSQIKSIIGIDSSADDDFYLKKIASLGKAENSDIAFLFDRGDQSVFSSIDLELIKKSKARIIISEKEVIPGKKYLIVNDALDAFSKIVNFVNSDNSKKFISDKAEISKAAKLEENIKIGGFSVISENSSLGKSSIIGTNVFIGKNVFIGENVKIYSGAKILDNSIIGANSIIHSNAVIGSDGFGYSVTKAGLKKIPQIGFVQIGNNVEIGASTTIDRASFDKTIIGDGCKIDNLVHIAHNVIIGPHTAVLAQTGIAGGAIIGSGCQIGGQVAIKDHIKIGDGVKIVSKSGVIKDIKDGQVVAGIPSMPFSKWKRAALVFGMLPEYLKKFKEREKNKMSFFKRLFN